MAKSGLKSNHGISSTNIETIKSTMKRMHSSQQSMAYAQSLNLSVDRSKGRKFVTTIIAGVEVKRYI